jgi:heme exporter protein A
MQRRAGEALMKLIAEGLTSIRGGRSLFSELSFSVGGGEAMLLLGPNGAGKTTLIRTIAGLLGPAAGSIRIDGGDAERSVGEQCHYVGHLNALKSSLTVDENAAFWCRFLGGRGDGIDAALAAFGLAGLRDIPAAYLSAGQKRRLGLARVLLANRPIWLLDEPTVSLDRVAQAALATAMEGHLARGGLVIAATHVPLGLPNARELHLGAAAEAA